MIERPLTEKNHPGANARVRLWISNGAPALQSLVVIPVLICFIGYIAFIASGPMPIRIAGFRLDILFAAGLAVFSLASLPRVATHYPPVIPLAVGLFLLAALPSVVIAQNARLALFEWMVTAGYATVAVLAPLAVHRQLANLRTFLLAAAVLVAAALIYLHHFQGYGTTARLALAWSADARDAVWTEESGWVDPNLTAIGLVMSVAVYFPNLQTAAPGWIHPTARRMAEVVGISIVLIATVMLLSRTAVLSSAVGMAAGFAAVWLFGDSVDRGSATGPIRIYIWVFIVTSIGLMTIASSQLIDFYERTVGFANSANRAELVDLSWNAVIESPMTVIFGVGFSSTNPHNELMRFLTSSGIVGLVAFIFMFGAFYWALCRRKGHDPFHLFCQNLLFFFLFTSIQTYGHTKTLWAPLMFLLANYLADRENPGRAGATAA